MLRNRIPPRASRTRSPTTIRATAATADYIEYRSIPELSQIQISTGVVRGKSAVDRLKQGCDGFIKRGIYPCLDTSGRKIYRRTEKMDGHVIDTLLTIDPPPPGEKRNDGSQEAEKEMSWIRHVIVRIDGHRKFNCSLGDSPTDELTVYGISIYPEDGTVDAAASDPEGYELTLPSEATKMDSPTVIKDDTFEDPGSSDDMPDERPAPVKVMWPGGAKAAKIPLSPSSSSSLPRSGKPRA